MAPESAEEFLTTLLGKAPGLDAIKRLLLERTEGNPFFLEESVRTLVETAFLAGERGAYRLAQAAENLEKTLQIPATAKAILAARIDRLSPENKRLLQAAAVIGKDIPFGLLQAIAEEPEEVLRRGLTDLQAAEFLYESRLFPDLEYTFRHALTQEVAYQNLLAARRLALHAAVGRALELSYADRLEQVYDRLAHHYSKTDNAPKAVEYLARFAEKAAATYANADAAKAFQDALVHAERLPTPERDRRCLDLAVRQAQCLHFLGRRQEVVDLLLRYQGSLERLREPSLAGQYYFWLGFAHDWLGHRIEGAKNLHRSLEEATRIGDGALMGRVHRALATQCVYSGQPLDQAVAHGRQAVSLLERTDDYFWLSQALFALGYSLYFTGDFESVLEVTARLGAVGETTGNRRARADAPAVAGLTYAARGEWAKGIEGCERALELSPDQFETAFVLACLGRACWEAGEAGRAVSRLEQAVELGDRVRSLQFRCWFRTMLGGAYVLEGQIGKAREVISEALKTSVGAEFSLGVGLSQQVLGWIARAEGFHAEAQRHLAEALQTFDSLNCRFEAARAHLDLAAMAHAQGKTQAIAPHLKQGRALFKALRVPKYVDRAEQLAKELGAVSF